MVDNNDGEEQEQFQDDILVDHQIDDTINATEEDYEFYRIQNHRWKDGELMFTVELTSGKSYEIPFSLLKKDRPIETARYIKNQVVENKRGGRYEQWSKKILIRAQRVIRRMHRHHNVGRMLRLYSKNEIKIRRISKNQRTKKKKNRIKFGMEVPNNVKHALLIDKINQNNAWGEAIIKEMSALNKAGV